MSRADGPSPEDVERQQKQQFRRQQHAQNLSSGGGSVSEFQKAKTEWLEKLTETGMSDAATNTLDNMVDPAFVLGNLTGAETHEIKWRLHTMFLKIKALFPPGESSLQGSFRAFIFGDRDEDLTALTDKQEIIISQMIIGISALVSRSKDGFQQEKMVESISVSEVRDPEAKDDDLMGGLFS